MFGLLEVTENKNMETRSRLCEGERSLKDDASGEYSSYEKTVENEKHGGHVQKDQEKEDGESTEEDNGESDYDEDDCDDEDDDESEDDDSNDYGDDYNTNEENRLNPAFPETVHAYHPGGFHPTVVGDEYRDGQYRIIRKLAHGAFSTVWLCRDTKQVFSYPLAFTAY